MTNHCSPDTVDLLALLPDGLPACSRYDEYLRITKQDDTWEAFLEWSRFAVTAMAKSEGKA
jgi:hypothetical protein